MKKKNIEKCLVIGMCSMMSNSTLLGGDNPQGGEPNSGDALI